MACIRAEQYFEIEIRITILLSAISKLQELQFFDEDRKVEIKMYNIIISQVL